MPSSPPDIGGYRPYRTSENPGPDLITIKDLSEHGFGFAGPYYAPDIPEGETEWLPAHLEVMQDALNECAIHGIRFCYTVAVSRLEPSPCGPKGSAIGAPTCTLADESQHDDLTGISDQQLIDWGDQIEDQVELALRLDHSDRIGLWYIEPEELRGWRPIDMTLMKRIVLSVREADPLQRPILWYGAQHWTAETLQHHAPHLDLLTIGAYPHIAGNDYRRIQVRHAMTQITNAIAMSGTETLPYATLELLDDHVHTYDTDEEIARIPVGVRHDAYAAIANGALGFTVFSLFNRTELSDDAYKAYRDAWLPTVAEIRDTNLIHIARTWPRIKTAHIWVIDGPAAIEFDWQTDGGVQLANVTYPSVSLRAWRRNSLFGWWRRVTLIAVNSAEEPLVGRIVGIPSGRYEDLSTGATFNAVDGTAEVPFEPLQARVLRRRIWLL